MRIGDLMPDYAVIELLLLKDKNAASGSRLLALTAQRCRWKGTPKGKSSSLAQTPKGLYSKFHPPLSYYGFAER